MCFKKRKSIVKHTIHWYKLFPYVISEMKNPEWSSLLKAEKEKHFVLKLVRKIYNSNGNWYILEGLDYFWFDLQIFTNRSTGILYNDSCYANFQDLSDKKRYERLKEIAQENIDKKWNNFYSKFKKK